jgi:hypothetical protein
VIHYSPEAVDDLAEIRATDGENAMLMLFRWCESLDEPGTRAEAEFVGGVIGTFRLRVGDYNIMFELHESHEGDAVRIGRVRRRRR